MGYSTLSFAVAAGLIAALNPCGFAMLPAYLTLLVLGDDAGGGIPRRRSAAVGRALLATVLMALGFLLVFGAFGLVLAPLASSLQRYLPAITVAIGAALVGLGIWMLTGRELTVLIPQSGRGAPTGRMSSMFGYGVAYAIASLSCTIGPFLVVTSSTFGAGSILEGIVAYLGYAAGMTLVVGVLATTVALGGAALAAQARRLLPHVNRAAGGLLVIVGFYVGYYGIYELRLYFGRGSADDPIVVAAGSIQQTLAGWVDAAGAPTIAVALVVLVLAAIPLRRRRTPARRGNRHTS